MESTKYFIFLRTILGAATVLEFPIKLNDGKMGSAVISVICGQKLSTL